MHYSRILYCIILLLVIFLILTPLTTSVRQQQQQQHDNDDDSIADNNKYSMRNQRRRSKNNLPTKQQQRQQQLQQQLKSSTKFLTSDEYISDDDDDRSDDYDKYSDSAAAIAASDSMMAEDTDDITGVGGGKSLYDIYTCCNKGTGSCRTSCENLSLVQLTTDTTNGRGFRLELKKYCHPKPTEFWTCMNRTLEAVVRGAQWSGRRCCALGLSPRCRNACATSTSTDELINACRQSDEQHMYACFERQEAGDRCCSNARTSECLQACRDIFEPHTTHKRNNRQHLHEACDEKNNDVLQCVQNATNMTPVKNLHKFLPCCDQSQVESCRTTCRTALNSTAESIDIILDELEAGCGMLPHLPLMKCFLTLERKAYVPATATTNNEVTSQINQIGIDSAKLHCCEKALTSNCRRLCARTYSTEWTATSTLFESSCLMQPIELELQQCIDEVDEPCELGCDGMSFCTNFNNRPTELFRSCNRETDVAALSDLKLWQQQGNFTLSGVNLPIQNMTRCAPEKWKAIACALQIKPCTRVGHYNHICREDCYEILSECMDWTRMSSALSADAICARLNPEGEDVPCVSLRPYLEESDAPKETGGHHRVTSPCKGQPCNASEVCIPNRNESTSSYQCIPGCSLGETSNYLVPFGAFVRVPVLQDARASGFKVCRCSEHGRIEHCQPLPSFSYENCILRTGEPSIKHGNYSYLQCNLCSCFAEEITCTKKQCRFPGYTDASYTSLPCNCPTHYVPICGRNGNTYHSECIAKCLGLQDSEIKFGACSTWNPCRDPSSPASCPVGTECLEERKICLSNMQRPCLQYQCVNQTTDCQNTGQPVCDTKGVTHASACDLLNARATFGHWGSCYRSCSWKGDVCGINGVTYLHECAAWADYILVDYRGRCREVGLLAHDMGRRCRTVDCPSPPSPYCRGVVPPGACCPICAGAFRIIYSRKQIDRALYALRGQHKDLLTLHSVLHQLDALIQVAECQLTGFLTMEVGIFVAVVPRAIKPTRIQIEACTREAEKISTLIELQSHRITTNLVLSGLTVSHMIDASLENRGSSSRSIGGMLWSGGTAAIFASFVFVLFQQRFL